MIVFPVDPFVQSYVAGLSAYRYDSVSFKGFIASRGEDIDGVHDVEIPKNTSVGAIQMAYDATTKVFHCYYDADGAANGYSWTEYASMGVNGSGGSQNVSWGLSGTAPFQIGLYGISEGTTISSSQLYADNFSATTPGPEIDIQHPLGTSLVDGTTKKSFGTVVVGQSGTAKTFTIQNTGTSNLTGLVVSVDGMSAGDFIITPPAKTTLVPGGSTTFKVTFKPSGSGTRSAAIHIQSNDANENPFDIKLAGSGAL